MEGTKPLASMWCFSVFYFSDNSEYRPNVHFFQTLARKAKQNKTTLLWLWNNSFCPGVYSLELSECQVYISTCVNTLASNTVWSGSKLVEKTQVPKETIQSEEQIITISCQRGDDHSWNLVQGTVPQTMHTSWVPCNEPSAICLHDITFLSQCWPWHYIYFTDFLSSMTSRYLDS